MTTDHDTAWWDRLYAENQEQLPEGATEGADERRISWWMTQRLAKDEPPPAPAPVTVDHPDLPGLRITIEQPPAPAAPTRLRRRDRTREVMWLAYHGGAALTGYALQLGPLMSDAIHAAGPRGGLSLGVGLVAVTGILAAGGRSLAIPAPFRPVVVWCAHIPLATAALALLLFAPGSAL